MRPLWLVIKYGLVAAGAYAWIGLWFQRSFWLGLIQLLIVIPALWYEIEKRHASGRW
jgi:hypothetical protein